MYNIEVQFNLGDIAWFIWANKVTKAVIKEVTIRIGEREDSWRYRIASEKAQIQTIYFFKEENGVELPCSLESQFVFGSKENLLASL